MSDSDTDAIWVSSDVAPDGRSYLATVHYGPDLSHAMHSGDTVSYVSAVLAAAEAAQYDAAVFGQITTKLEVDARDAGELVAMLRKRRDRDSWNAGPLTLTPGVSAFTREPFLACRAGKRQWQWQPQDARQHAVQVLEVGAVVDYDTHYRDLLVEHLDLDPQQAMVVVADIVNFRTN